MGTETTDPIVYKFGDGTVRLTEPDPPREQYLVSAELLREVVEHINETVRLRAEKARLEGRILTIAARYEQVNLQPTRRRFPWRTGRKWQWLGGDSELLRSSVMNAKEFVQREVS